MGWPQIRRRYAYPSGDLATGQPTVDLALDAVSSRTRRDTHGLGLTVLDPSTSIVVIGFPRSGNTTLTYWLSTFAHEGVTVVDGRITHSALDIHRCARLGLPVLIPAREPLGTCASMMLRRGEATSQTAAREVLRAYAGWYRMATKALNSSHIHVVPFEVIVDDPWHACSWSRIGDLIDATRAAETPTEDIVDSLRQDLASIPGQGQPQNGVPAEWMISLPDPTRAALSTQTRAILQSAGCARDLQSAERAYRDFMDRAENPGAQASITFPVAITAAMGTGILATGAVLTRLLD